MCRHQSKEDSIPGKKWSMKKFDRQRNQEVNMENKYILPEENYLSFVYMLCALFLSYLTFFIFIEHNRVSHFQQSHAPEHFQIFNCIVCFWKTDIAQQISKHFYGGNYIVFDVLHSIWKCCTIEIYSKQNFWHSGSRFWLKIILTFKHCFFLYWYRGGNSRLVVFASDIFHTTISSAPSSSPLLPAFPIDVCSRSQSAIFNMLSFKVLALALEKIVIDWNMKNINFRMNRLTNCNNHSAIWSCFASGLPPPWLPSFSTVAARTTTAIRTEAPTPLPPPQYELYTNFDSQFKVLQCKNVLLFKSLEFSENCFFLLEMHCQNGAYHLPQKHPKIVSDVDSNNSLM